MNYATTTTQIYTYIHRQSKGTQYSQKEGESKSRFFKCLSDPRSSSQRAYEKRRKRLGLSKRRNSGKNAEGGGSQKQATEIEGPLISFRPSFLPHSRFLGGHPCPPVREKEREEGESDELSIRGIASVNETFFSSKNLCPPSRDSLRERMLRTVHCVCYSKLQRFYFAFQRPSSSPPCTEAAAAAEGAGEEDRGRHRTTTPPLWGRRTEMR